MLAAIADVEKVECKHKRVQHCTAVDIPSLFVEWLNEILYQREVSDLLFASAHVVHLQRTEQGWTLEGVACGEPLDQERHEIYTEIKAATYSGLEYRRERDHYLIQCVVDL